MITAVTAALQAELTAMAADLEFQARLLAGEVGLRARNRLVDAADVPLLEAGWTRLRPMILKPVTIGFNRMPHRMVQFSRTADGLMHVAWDTPNTITVTVYGATESQMLDMSGETVLTVDPAIWETL